MMPSVRQSHRTYVFDFRFFLLRDVTLQEPRISSDIVSGRLTRRSEASAAPATDAGAAGFDEEGNAFGFFADLGRVFKGARCASSCASIDALSVDGCSCSAFCGCGPRKKYHDKTSERTHTHTGRSDGWPTRLLEHEQSTDRDGRSERFNSGLVSVMRALESQQHSVRRVALGN